MASAEGLAYTRAGNDALRDELIEAAWKTERLVAASDELLADRGRFHEHCANMTASAVIEPDLGIVRIAGDRRITIDLEPAKIAICDVSRLGDRILAALAAAERELDDAVAEGRREAADPPPP